MGVISVVAWSMVSVSSERVGHDDLVFGVRSLTCTAASAVAPSFCPLVNQDARPQVESLVATP
jgi:hypothetical protein